MTVICEWRLNIGHNVSGPVLPSKDGAWTYLPVLEMALARESAMSLSRVAPEVVLEVDLDAVRANFLTVAALVGPSVKAAAVVKSDAYGLGMVPVANALVEAGCDFFFVANLEEAVLLRSACPTVSIAVFRDDLQRQISGYREHNLIPVVNNRTDLDVLCASPGSCAYFLNIETGFSRLGLGFDDMRRLYLAGQFGSNPPSAVMSHLACSDDPIDPTNMLQKNRFLAACELLKPPRASLIASAGVWLDRSYHFSMVRVGSALYGLNNAGIQPSPLRPVIRLIARVLEVREVARREAVGYGATFRPARRSRLATIALGYKNGLPWSCANKISVRFAGFSSPLVGRVSMEYIVADVTDVPESFLHDDLFVEILGSDFTPDDLARVTGVNPQEILTRLGAGCPKRYRPATPASSLGALSADRGPDHLALAS